MPLPITLIMIESDPLSSHKPAEGIRLAAGLHVWKRTEIQLLLCGPAAFCLQEFHDDCIDEDNFTHYLPMVRESKSPVFVDGRFADREMLAPELWPFSYVDSAQIADLLAKAKNIIRL